MYADRIRDAALARQLSFVTNLLANSLANAQKLN